MSNPYAPKGKRRFKYSVSVFETATTFTFLIWCTLRYIARIQEDHEQREKVVNSFVDAHPDGKFSATQTFSEMWPYDLLALLHSVFYLIPCLLFLFAAASLASNIIAYGVLKVDEARSAGLS